MNRAAHWVEAERLQAQGIEQVTELITIREHQGLWQDAAAAQLETLAGLYFQAAQISAMLAQAGPGVDAEVARLQSKKPGVPALRPVPESRTAGPELDQLECIEPDKLSRGSCGGPVKLQILRQHQYGERAAELVPLCRSHTRVGRRGGWVV